MSRIMYLGMRESYGEFSYKYVTINEDSSLGKEWTFGKKLFRKGTPGAVYDCEFEGSSISYKTKENPVYWIKKEGEGTNMIGTSLLFPELLNESETLHSQAETSKRYSSKDKSKMHYDLQDIRGVYKRLNATQRSRFIADLVYQITK